VAQDECWTTPIEEELDAALNQHTNDVQQQISTPLTVTKHMDMMTAITVDAKKELPLSLVTLLDTNRPLLKLSK
jgi:hypothetical protein